MRQPRRPKRLAQCYAAEHADAALPTLTVYHTGSERGFADRSPRSPRSPNITGHRSRRWLSSWRLMIVTPVIGLRQADGPPHHRGVSSPLTTRSKLRTFGGCSARRVQGDLHPWRSQTATGTSWAGSPSAAPEARPEGRMGVTWPVSPEAAPGIVVSVHQRAPQIESAKGTGNSSHPLTRVIRSWAPSSMPGPAWRPAGVKGNRHVTQ